MPNVVDYSYSHPSPQQIKDAGYIGAVRYLGWDFGRGPRCISQAEFNALRAAGLDVALVWETTANMCLRGAAGGDVDGREAARLRDLLGFPSAQFIYAAVDFDVQRSQYAVVDAYFEAFSQHALVEAYGHYDYIEHRGSGWQCAAWSGFGNGSGGSNGGRRLSNKARMFQRVGYVLNNTCDLNDVYSPNWGQSGTTYNGPVGDPGVGGPVPETPSNVLVGTVQEIQADLKLLADHNNDPSLDPGPVDGVWGPLTEAAVRAFQSKSKDTDGNPLVVDGIVGEKTMNALRVLAYLVGLDGVSTSVPADDPQPVVPAPPVDNLLRKGSTGGAVKFAQGLLIGLGYGVGPTGADGVFGDATEQSLRKFQSDHGIAVDGVWGPQTRDAVAAAYAGKFDRPSPTLSNGSSGPEVTKLQKCLNAFDQNLVEDGSYGPATAQAVTNFQSFWGIGVDGVYGPETANALDAALNMSGK